MGRIQRLPAAVANQIAAGEVVERPAAVVRELVENSIDAGASAISVVVRRAGKTEIRVTDDGVGMSPEDARLAVERHATSKIESVDDLTAVGSLGFRGEALPSIASVSRFRLATREPEASEGWEIRVEGGAEPSGRPAGMPPGTVVEVRDLFFNTPARRKFLRAEPTEAAHILTAVRNLALAWPQVRFEMKSNERQALALEPAEDAAARLAQLEPDWSRDAIPVEARSGDFSVRAFLSPPMAARGASSRLVLFVNGRQVRDRRLFHAVAEAYRRLSSLVGTPRAFVFLEIPPGAVDVNVHPAKAEVRFADPGATYRAVFRGVLAALEGSPKRVDLGPGTARPRTGGGGRVREESPPGGAWDGKEIGELLYGADADRPEPGPPRADGSDPSAGYFDFGPAAPAVLGQFRRTYILAENRRELLLVDQHAAEERVIFNRLLEQTAAPATVPLLQPAALDLTPLEAAALVREREQLAAAGFVIEPFGGDSWLLRGVPEELGVGRGLKVLRRSLGAAEEECTENAAHDARARILARVACHAAITANVPLTGARMEEVLRRLWETPNPSTCPHGRPTVLRLDLSFLEKRFRRR